MITKDNFKEEFLNLIEYGKKEIDRTIPIMIKKYSNDYVVTRWWRCLFLEIEEEYIKREKELFEFSKTFNSYNESKFISNIKEEYGYCVDFYGCDIEKYYIEILEEYYKSKGLRIQGWDGLKVLR